MYLIQKHKMFKKIANNLKGHYKIKISNDIFITQLARQLKRNMHHLLQFMMEDISFFKDQMTKF